MPRKVRYDKGWFLLDTHTNIKDGGLPKKIDSLFMKMSYITFKRISEQ